MIRPLCLTLALLSSDGLPAQVSVGEQYALPASSSTAGVASSSRQYALSANLGSVSTSCASARYTLHAGFAPLAGFEQDSGPLLAAMEPRFVEMSSGAALRLRGVQVTAGSALQLAGLDASVESLGRSGIWTRLPPRRFTWMGRLQRERRR